MNLPYQRALILHEQARYTDAEHQLRQALADEPDDAQAYAMLAVCLVQQAKFKAAREAAELAIVKDSSLAFAYYAIAATLLKDTKFESGRQLAIGSEVSLGRSYRLQVAEANIRQAIRLHPENANYHTLLANVLLERGLTPMALDAARLALAFEHDQPDALKIIAVVAGNLGSSDAALSASVAAISATPDGAIENAIHGAALLRAGQRPRAMQHLEEALRLDPNHAYIRKQFLEGARSRSRIYALSVRTRHRTVVVANPFAAFYSIALTLLIGVGFALAMFVSAKLHVNDARALLILAAFMLPSYVIMTLRGWIDFRLQFDEKARHLLSKSERRQANAVVWSGASLIAAQAIPIGAASGHGAAGVWVFAAIEVSLTFFFIWLNRRVQRRPIE